MNVLRSAACALLAILCSAAGFSQDNCPREKARRVGLDIRIGPVVDCGSGARLQINGLQIATAQGDCPLFVILTPAHDIPEPSELRTRVERTGWVTITVAFFKCDHSYFIFIPIGSSCVHSHNAPLGQLPLLVTVPCEEREVEG